MEQEVIYKATAKELRVLLLEPIKIPLPHISGSDVSGTVVDVGENVLSIKKETE